MNETLRTESHQIWTGGLAFLTVHEVSSPNHIPSAWAVKAPGNQDRLSLTQSRSEQDHMYHLMLKADHPHQIQEPAQEKQPRVKQKASQDCYCSVVGLFLGATYVQVPGYVQLEKLVPPELRSDSYPRYYPLEEECSGDFQALYSHKLSSQDLCLALLPALLRFAVDGLAAALGKAWK